MSDPRDILKNATDAKIEAKNVLPSHLSAPAVVTVVIIL